MRVENTGLVGGQGEAAGGAGPGGVVVSGVGGEDSLATVPTQKAAQVGAQLCRVVTPGTATVKVPDPGEVRPPGHGAEERVLVARHDLLPGLDGDGGGHSQPASVCVSPGVGDTAVGEEAEHGEQADTLVLPSYQAVTRGSVRQDYPCKAI